jgi:hypothetical protein
LKLPAGGTIFHLHADERMRAMMGLGIVVAIVLLIIVWRFNRSG